MNFTGNSNTLLLVHRQMERVSAGNVFDIVLTPQFYTMKREVLPVKYAFQAKRIAPSLFEGLVENLHVHDYFVYRDGEEWVFIAYNMHEVITFLQIKGLSPEHVGKVFFAQQFASQLEYPLTVNKESVLVLLNGTVTLVPNRVVTIEKRLKPEMLKAPKKAARLELESISVFNRKETMIVAVVLVLFGLLWVAEGWRYNQANRLLDQKREALYADYPALQSAYTRESIVQKYRKIDTQERKKRDIIGKIAGLIFKGVTLTSFDMDTKHFKAVLVAKDAKTAERLKTFVKRTGFKYTVSADKQEITLEGAL